MTANPQQHNSCLMQEDIYGLLAAMLQKEGDYLCQNYLHTDSSDDTEIDVDTCRSKMCQWIYQVVDCTRLQRETAAVAVSYLDRFMCTTSPSAYKARYDRKEYQLVALTSLYIATKIFEPFALDASLVSKLSRGLHTTEEIIALEYEILTALRWRVNGPTSFQFVNYLLELLTCEDKTLLYERSHFQTELSTGDYTLISLRRSVIAVASVLNSLECLPKDSLSLNERIRFAEAISMATGVDIFSPMINTVRMRLLESYTQSSGYSLEQVGFLPIVDSKPPANDTKSADIDSSPGCVMKERAISIDMSIS